MFTACIIKRSIGKSVTVVKSFTRPSFANKPFRLYKSARVQDSLKVGLGEMLPKSKDISY